MNRDDSQGFNPSGSRGGDHDSGQQSSDYRRPNYLTVGSGPTSDSANKLTAILDDDSGYGGSALEGEMSNLSQWRPIETMDQTMRVGSNDPQSEDERRIRASHVHQLHYNQNRTLLGRAITRTMEILKSLQAVNKQWPAHYPSVKPPEVHTSQANPRPGLHPTQSTFDQHLDRVKSRPDGPRRAETSLGESSTAESSSAASKRPAPEPRLVTPQLARDFSVLKIDLKMDGLAQTEIIHSFQKDSKALAQLLDEQIKKSLRHLQSLQERIEDTSSKVLVTGDLNAGKSTFCNALLRRKVLPEDEQPCTSIFCEVLDVRENGGLEEVHAVPLGAIYNRNDERTYHVYPIKKLEQIVVDNAHYSQCKVYIKDIRSVDESLLNNGVLDIALIDAPGLNNDSLKTTAVFARQEEIDVVVFVVAANNHFTLSAREFIYDAAREKAYIFMVVNGYDKIQNKQRCQEQILKQVAHLSPATFKESSELVHFVSSNAIPVAAVSESSSGGAAGGSGSPSGDPENGPYDDDDDDDGGNDGKDKLPLSSGKGKGKEKEKQRDFAELETSLRRFVLEKRARSKLAPAKTYMMNVLEDLETLATVNRDVAQSELDRVTTELMELEPAFEQSKKIRSEASEGVDHSTEDCASDVYAHTRTTLTSAIADVSQRDLGVEYPGFWSAYQFAEELTSAMLHEISNTVGVCEDYARAKTTNGVNTIKSLGLLHLGDSYTDLHFRSEKMFRRKKDALARQIDISVDAWDFFDITNMWERQEKVAGTGMAVTVAGVLGGRMIGGVGWIDGALGAAKVAGSKNMRSLIIPGLLATVAIAISYAIASIPQSLPRRLSNKVAAQLAAIDFTHANALRISSEVRRALKIPADELRMGLQKNYEELRHKREDTDKVKKESEVALKYFGNLMRDSNHARGTVDQVDLEGPAPGVAGGYDF